MNESDFADAINADPDNRDMQLIYADWLDDQGDPRGEAWRVLVQEGLNPQYQMHVNNKWNGWNWASRYHNGATRGNRCIWLPHCQLPHELFSQDFCDFHIAFPTFHAAMDAAAIAWVRCHRDGEFLKIPQLSEGDFDRLIEQRDIPQEWRERQEDDPFARPAS